MADRNHTKGMGGVMVAMALASCLRLLLIVAYEPLYGNDAPSYAAMAHMIRSGDFTDYIGVRTPGYPVFMLLAGMNNQAIRVLQHVAGMLSLGVVYALGRRLLPSAAMSAMMLLLAVSIQFPFYESIIQTEALAGAAILASLFYFIRGAARGGLDLFLCGFIASLGALIRPHLVILPPVFLALYVFQHRQDVRSACRRAVHIAWPAVFLIGGWIGFNSIRIGRPVYTTLPKADLIAHMIPQIADADPRFGPVKDAFQEAYEVMRPYVESAGDNRGFYTRYAYDRLRQMGLPPSIELRDDIYEMAVDLVRQHPWKYAKSVLWAWGRFWRVHLIVYEECFGSRQAWYPVAMLLWVPIKAIWLAVSGMFLLLLPLSPFLRMRSEAGMAALVCATLVLAASLSQAFTQYYDSARFAVPFLPLIAIYVGVVATELFHSRKVGLSMFQFNLLAGGWRRRNHGDP